MSARRFKSKKALSDAWEEYKTYCDTHKAVKTEFSQKLSDFVTREVWSPITYTIEGFCAYVGLSRQAFYADYDKNDTYLDIVTRMHEECETDNREKFESGEIPTQLAGLWMSKYGYTTKTDTNMSGSGTVVIVDDCDQ
ncbi:MAG: DNA-packaging protein [Bacteroidales bacterium]|nr:DNA-packaging protein [Bacteroidales bacterium]